MTDKAAKIREIIANSYGGTDNYWVMPMFRKFRYTDGVKAVAEAAGAYWLIEAIFSHQSSPKVAREPFQVWTLRYNASMDHWFLEANDGDKGGGPKQIAAQTIHGSDFPAPGITLWLQNGVLLLPSEY